MSEKIELLRKVRDTGDLGLLHKHGLISSYPLTMLTCYEVYCKYRGTVSNPIVRTAEETHLTKNTVRKYLRKAKV